VTTPIRDEMDRLNFARRLAHEAGALTREYFGRTDLGVERKRDGTEVTDADKACERLIRAGIARDFPDDGILGEEFDDKPAMSDYRWIIDPIDGTFSFARGVPLYAVLIACERLDRGRSIDGGVRLGVITLPALDNETVFAVRGGGAFHQVGGSDPTPARVSATENPTSATLCVTSRSYFERADRLDVFERMHEALSDARGFPDAYAAVLLATGRVEAMVEPVVEPWDIAPLQPILAEAGGTCTDWAGRETVFTNSLLATNGLLHEQLLRVANP
jgi:histidinol-phosphatase